MNLYLSKAREALEAAKLLLAAEHDGSAANRAYYAIFHAAQAVVAEVASVQPRDVKTHSGLRRLFDLHVVKPGLIDKDVARHFKDVEGTRFVADYSEQPVKRAEVQAAVRDAEEFVRACATILRESHP